MLLFLHNFRFKYRKNCHWLGLCEYNLCLEWSPSTRPRVGGKEEVYLQETPVRGRGGDALVQEPRSATGEYKKILFYINKKKLLFLWV